MTESGFDDMWIPADGVIRTVSIPTANVPGGQVLQARIAALDPAESDALDEILDTIQWTIADEIDTLTIDPDEESGYEGEAIPVEVLAGVDWDELLGSSISTKFQKIDLRWRLDLLQVVMQAVAERG